MSESDTNNLPVGFGGVPPAEIGVSAAVPPLLPPRLPPPLPAATPGAPGRGLSPWVIVAICVAGGLVLLMVTAVVVVLLTTFKSRSVNPMPVTLTTPPLPRRSEPLVKPVWPTAELTPGVTYTNIRMANVPWSIHVLKIDRAHHDLSFYPAHAGSKVLGVSLIAEQARMVPRELGQAIAGINGDFYLRDNPTYAGDPRGLQILNGDLLSAPDTWSVWFDSEGNPHLDEVKAEFSVTWPDGRKTGFGLNEQRQNRMAVLYTPTYGTSTRVSGGRDLVLGRAGDGPWLPLQAGESYRARVLQVRASSNTPLSPNTMLLSLGPDILAGIPEVTSGAELEISTATRPDLKGVKSAIGGGPALLHEGQRFNQTTPPPGAVTEWTQRSKYERHPRSAVGWSATEVCLVTVDGRQARLSVGMKLAELAEFMANLGCTEAMNFDGGKSAQMWVNGRIVNSPCQGEDTVANSLLVVRRGER